MTRIDRTQLHPARPPGRLHGPRHAVHRGRRARRGRLPPARRAGRSWPASTASFPCGTTGESPTLTTGRARSGHRRSPSRPSPSARRGRASRRSPGPARTTPRRPIAATRRAAELGADAALVVAPYYNRPDQRMLEAHYRAVADDGGLPIVVYNVPSRTGTNVEPATLLRLAEHPRIVGVKEASREPRPDRPDLPGAAARLRRASPATTPGRCRCWRWAATASSRSRRTRSRARWSRLCTAARAGDWDGARRHPRALAAALPGQLRRRPEPGAGEGRARADGPDRSDVVRAPLLPLDEPARASLADASLRRPACSTRPAAGWPRAVADGRRSARRPWHDRGATRGRSRPIRRRSSTTSTPGGCGPPGRTRPRRAAGVVDAAVKRGDPRPVRATGRPASGRSAMRWQFRDRAGLPLKDLLDGPEARAAADGEPRLADRAGRHDGPGRASTSAWASSIMPPSFVNVGAWIGDDAMIDSHVLVGLVRPDRRRGSTSRPASRSAACSSRPARGPSSSRTTRSSGRAAACSRACSSDGERSSGPA